MEYYERIPDQPLKQFINKAWYVSYPSAHHREKILPLPVHHFIINLSDEPYRIIERGGERVGLAFVDGFVSGIQSHYLVIENPPALRNIGVELTPFGLRAFTDMLLESIADTVQESEAVFPGSLKLATRLKGITDPQKQIDLLLAFMSEKLRPKYTPPVQLEKSLRLLEKMSSVTDVAREVGISHKHLIHQWKRHVGVTPKHYQSIVRLQQVIRWFDVADKPIRWSQASSELSFCDQPYFIRAFRQLTGFSPREYARTLSDYPAGERSFVALDDGSIG